MHSVRSAVRRFAGVGLVIALSWTTAACNKGRDASFIGTFQMGERVQAGPLTYSVLEGEWKNELGPGGRGPKDRFLFVRLSITNNSGSNIAVHGLTLIPKTGKSGVSYPEVTEGMDKVDHWLGLLRNVPPGKTEQGYIVFDAPMSAYKLVVSDGGEVGSEKYAHVEIPVDIAPAALDSVQAR